LHHYDRIDLLKPSVRLDNGYRVYSEKDLLQLQQIIALKFFGFELSKIRALLTGNAGALEHFAAQAQFLQEKAQAYVTASQTLKSIIAEVKEDTSIPWQSIIQLIEVYRMTAELEKTWAGEVLTPEELKQYAQFEADLKTRFTPRDRELFTENWLALVNEVKANVNKDPKSAIGLQLAKQIMDLVGGLYGKENANLRHSIWEKGFKKGKMDGDRALAPEIVEWLDKAIDHYYRERIYTLLDNIELGVTPALLESWNELMTEMFGNSEELKQGAFAAGASENETRIGPNAKKWLQQFLK
jgi:DNA-binding transcriptional MerR regulator